MEGTYVPSWTWNNSPPAKTEKSPSGIGGGSAFVIDQIRFGLEICMDHQFGRLSKSSPPVEKVHVQLVPSGGAKIQRHWLWTVPDGLVFNVDMAHCQALKGNNDLPFKGNVMDLALDASAHYDTLKVWGNGAVVLFEPADIAY